MSTCSDSAQLYNITYPASLGLAEAKLGSLYLLSLALAALYRFDTAIPLADGLLVILRLFGFRYNASLLHLAGEAANHILN